MDLARGIALAGMMLTHLGPQWDGENPPIGDALFSGRAAPLFALLAGVSMTLVQRRDPEGAGRVTATMIRGLVLVALGLSLGMLHDLPVLVILAVYGVLVIAVLPARLLPTRWLMALSAAWVVGGPVVLLWLRLHRDLGPVEQPAWRDLDDPGHVAMTVLVTGGYPAIVWAAFVLVGLALGRLDLTRRTTAGVMAAGGAATVLLTVAVGYWAITTERVTVDRHGWRSLFEHSRYPYEPATWSDLWLVGPHTNMPLAVAGAIGSAALVLGLCALAGGRIPILRAAGTMTLTLYVVHVLWTWRAWVTSAEFDALEPRDVGYDVWAQQVVVLFGAAALWTLVFRRGPLESVVRLLSVSGPNRLRRRLSPRPVTGEG